MIQGLSNSYRSNTNVECAFMKNRMLTFESCLFSHQNTKILQKLLVNCTSMAPWLFTYWAKPDDYSMYRQNNQVYCK